MKSQHVDLFVLVKNENRNDGVSQVVDRMNNTSGVNQAKISERLKRLMVIEYNPLAISSQTILASIRQQGFQASLIGM